VEVGTITSIWSMHWTRYGGDYYLGVTLDNAWWGLESSYESQTPECHTHVYNYMYNKNVSQLVPFVVCRAGGQVFFYLARTDCILV
jgi:hypothetical protein